VIGILQQNQQTTASNITVSE